MSIIARNADYTKEYNRKLVLRLLRYQPLSRAEIARRTGLTRASTSLIASELLADGLVREMSPVANPVVVPPRRCSCARRPCTSSAST